MKRNRLTATRMALGSLRGQKKRYFSLASGIFLAVFFATALVLASASLGKTALDDYRARMGEQDVALLNIDATEETIRQTGIAQRVRRLPGGRRRARDLRAVR
ncbi:MAG: hypothetical protein KHX36_13305 [Clostridiales bacterium]|nr:hypothetical protein [Clostridiales bacterium]